MIISRTPFRISFAGGGTDLPDYYRKKSGCVLSTAINKYMYISVHQPFDNRIRLKYSQTELVDNIESIVHPIIREALKLTDILGGIEITSVSDIPAQAGLGSSSTFSVGLLHALHAFKGEYVPSERLAVEACAIEMNRLAEPVGKQDQYIAAYGGLQFIRFNPDETVFVDPVICSAETRMKFHERLMLFHCSGVRSARDVLNDQKKHIPEKIKNWDRMVELAEELHSILLKNQDVGAIGPILHESWMLKREMGDKITNNAIDGWYDKARKSGAAGGKLLGAGGGGFLLFFVEPDKQRAVAEALSDLRHIPFDFEPQGSKIIYLS
ncbi:MAG: GHMP kinase [Kiritimatiellae bacterium]|nr:GHMP kinase [Kiritimatiellia bacterium]MDD5521323.1 GHMP kinase [Kiritimatiellia bacterium]